MTESDYKFSNMISSQTAQTWMEKEIRISIVGQGRTEFLFKALRTWCEPD